MAPTHLVAPVAFRWSRRSERPLLTAFSHANKLLEAAINSQNRVLGRPTYSVYGQRVVIRAPFFAPDAHVPSDEEAYSLGQALKKLFSGRSFQLLGDLDPIQAVGSGIEAEVQLKLHRVKQPQLDAQMLAEIIGRNVLNLGVQRVLNDVKNWLPTIRPEVLLENQTALPGHITGFRVDVRGIFPGNAMASKHSTAFGTFSQRPGTVRDFALKVFTSSYGTFGVKVTLQMKRNAPAFVP